MSKVCLHQPRQIRPKTSAKAKRCGMGHIYGFRTFPAVHSLHSCRLAAAEMYYSSSSGTCPAQCHAHEHAVVNECAAAAMAHSVPTVGAANQIACTFSLGTDHVIVAALVAESCSRTCNDRETARRPTMSLTLWPHKQHTVRRCLTCYDHHCCRELSSNWHSSSNVQSARARVSSSYSTMYGPSYALHSHIYIGLVQPLPVGAA